MKHRPVSIEQAKQYIKDRILESATGCWEWTLKLDGKGYGTVGGSIKKQFNVLSSHRASYIVFKGPITDPASVVRHLCSNSKCCNPDHLELGTHLENMLDKSESISDMSDSRLVNLESILENRLKDIKMEISKRQKVPPFP